MPLNPSHKPPPSGTVTFLFTDIEGSTNLLTRLGNKYPNLLAAHRGILRAAFQSHWGREVDTQGDAFFYSFSRATEAVVAAVEAQRTLAEHDWPGGVEVRVRMGLHTGEPLLGDEGYVGMDVHRAARVAHAGHGGQVLLSQTTTPLVQDQLPKDVTLLDLGRHRLKDMNHPERITQLVIDGLPSKFPPLASLEALPPEFPHEYGPLDLPEFLQEDDRESDLGRIFVGRERELGWLREHLQRSAAGAGGVAFLEGDAGRGKTALMDEFAQRAMEADPDLLVAMGSCSAFAGRGDPYLPFREALAMLTGEVETRWRAGAIERSHAMRLWGAMPRVAQALVQQGTDLLGALIPGAPLLNRLHIALEAGDGWVERLGKIVDRNGAVPRDLDQRNLFEQCERVLSEVAKSHPILLLLDDLQWADGASIDLLFHLGRRLSGRRLLILGAYRPEEVGKGRGPDSAPFGAALSELKRVHGDITLDISRTSVEEDRHFVDAYVEHEPNRLSLEFKERLYQHTRGHPLFTVEVLRNLQERGDLYRDPNGSWVEASDLDWEVIPARVEGVIKERIDRLDTDLQEILRIASVEGSTFTAQVLIEIRNLEAHEISKRLHQELAREHRLVQEEGPRDVEGRRLYRYRFSHELFQRHVYENLGEFERSTLHGQLGAALEELYAGQAHLIAPQLARHYRKAGEFEKAIHYLLMSGDQARMVYANQEAIQYYSQALDQMQDHGLQAGVVQTLLKLGLVHTADFDSEAAERAYARAFTMLEEQPHEIGAPQAHVPETTLRMAVSEPVEWDPGKIGDDMSTFIAVQLYQALVEVSPDYNVLPAGAERWEVDEGGRLYTFRLHSGLRWSDGSPLTAHDFEYAWQRNRARQVESPLSGPLIAISKSKTDAEKAVKGKEHIDVHCPDDRTLQVRLNRPSAYFPQLMALPWAFPAPKRVLEAQGKDWPDPTNQLCNGPYMIEDWSPGEQLTLVRNPHYRGRFPGNVRRVYCDLMRDFDLALDAYARGNVDVVSMIDSDANTVAKARVRFPEELKLFPIPSTFYLAFLADRPPFDDARVRKAFIHAIDREQLIRQASRGQYRPASGGFVPPGMPGHSAGIGLSFDPNLARRLLGTSGYGAGDQFPAVTLMTLRTGMDDPNVRFLSKAWHEHLGIDVIHEDVEWREFLRRRDQDPPHLSLSGWSADYPDPDSMLRLVFHSSEGVNPPRWKDERFDALVEEGARVLDQGERIQLYQEADRILVSEQAVILPIGYAQGRQLSKPWVRMPEATPQMVRLRDVILIKPDAEKEEE